MGKKEGERERERERERESRRVCGSTCLLRVSTLHGVTGGNTPHIIISWSVELVGVKG